MLEAVAAERLAKRLGMGVEKSGGDADRVSIVCRIDGRLQIAVGCCVLCSSPSGDRVRIEPNVENGRLARARG
jgi:hypothetical protein